MSESPDDSNCGGGPQPEQLYPGVEMGSAPSYEELLEEVKTLKQSLSKTEEKIRERALTRQHEHRKLMLTETLKLEKNLIETVKGLEECMGRASAQVREKEEEVRKLAKKVSRLRERDEQPRSVLEDGPGEDDQAKATTCPMIAVTILPEEVWKMILENLSDPKDLWNGCNTCQLFENLLRPWKTGWMLEQALPHLYRHLPGRKLLEIRQVSKGWNAGVNRFLENHPSIQPHKTESDPRRIDVVYPVKEKEIGNRNVFNFGPDEDLSVLEGLFPKRLGRNPFIGRYAIFHLRKDDGLEDSLEVEEQRWTKMYAFLETYGKEIWNLALYFPPWTEHRTKERIIELMTSKLFPLVPNLRKLFFNKTGCNLDIVDPEELPPAPNLKTLQVGRIGQDGIVDGLISKFNQQLEQLEVLHVGELGWGRVYDLEWPNLKELVLYFGVVDTDEDADLATLMGLRMPQLNRLTFNLMDEFEGTNIVRLVELINGLTVTTSLNSFRLVGPFDVIEFEPLDTNYFVSEGVKTLELVDTCSSTSTNSIPSHNFLRYFPLIENLVIIIRDSEDEPNPKYETEVYLLPDQGPNRTYRKNAAREDEVVEVNKYLYDGQMYKSNIWELLPRLKVLTFQWDVYTRENYEAYAKQRPSSSSTAWGGGSME